MQRLSGFSSIAPINAPRESGIAAPAPDAEDLPAEKTPTWLPGRDLTPATPSEHQLRAFCQALDKVDLHRHLEGAVTPELLLRLSRQYAIPLPTRDLDQLRKLVQVTDKDKTLLDFLHKFDVIGLAFTNTDAVKEITRQTILDASEDNVKYLELRFSPLYIAQQYHLSPQEVMDAVVAGVHAVSREASDTKVNLIVIAERELPLEKAWEVEKLGAAYQDQGVVGMDLANDEFHFPPAPFAPVFQAARQAGLHVTVHAGEAGPAANVRTAIEQLGAERIGHGVQTASDPSVEQEIIQRGVAIEMCPTSNEETHAADGLPTYPLRKFYNDGVKVGIHSDDPSVCGVTLSGECYKVVHNLGFTLPEVERMQLNAVDAAFLPAADKAALRARFQQQAGYLNELATRSTWLAPWFAAHPAESTGVGA